MYPRIEDAASEALSSSDGDFMKNVNIYYEFWFIPPFYSHMKIRVKGDAYKTSTALNSQNPFPIDKGLSGVVK